MNILIVEQSRWVHHTECVRSSLVVNHELLPLITLTWSTNSRPAVKQWPECKRSSSTLPTWSQTSPPITIQSTDLLTSTASDRHILFIYLQNRATAAFCCLFFSTCFSQRPERTTRPNDGSAELIHHHVVIVTCCVSTLHHLLGLFILLHLLLRLLSAAPTAPLTLYTRLASICQRSQMYSHTHQESATAQHTTWMGNICSFNCWWLSSARQHLLFLFLHVFLLLLFFRLSLLLLLLLWWYSSLG